MLAREVSLRVTLEAMGQRIDPSGTVAVLGARAVVTRHHRQALGLLLPLEMLAQGGTHHALELVTLGLHLGLVEAGPASLVLLGSGIVLGRGPVRAAALLARDHETAAGLEAGIRAAWAASQGPRTGSLAAVPSEGRTWT